MAHYFNLADCRVITVPLGESDDFVPFGVQIVGKPKSGNKGLFQLFGFASTNYNTPQPSFTKLKYCFYEDEYGFTQFDQEKWKKHSGHKDCNNITQ